MFWLSYYNSSFKFWSLELFVLQSWLFALYIKHLHSSLIETHIIDLGISWFFKWSLLLESRFSHVLDLSRLLRGPHVFLIRSTFLLSIWLFPFVLWFEFNMFLNANWTFLIFDTVWMESVLTVVHLEGQFLNWLCYLHLTMLTLLVFFQLKSLFL